MKKIFLLFLGIGFVFPSPGRAQHRAPATYGPFRMSTDHLAIHSCRTKAPENHKMKCARQSQTTSSRATTQKPPLNGGYLWPAISLLHTLPQEPGSDTFRWTWNPAAIQSGFMMRGNYIYESYVLRHQISRQAIFKKVRIRNQIRQAAAFWQSGNVQLGLAYARRIKRSGELVSETEDQIQPPQSYEEISDIVSPTLGYRFSFGLALALRTNFQKIQFIDQTPSVYYQNKTSIRLTSWDLGFEQNFGDWLLVDVFSNEIKELVNGEPLSGETNFKILNVSATVKWHKAWATVGLRLRRDAGPKDSLLFLHVSYPLWPKIWISASYTQSRHYSIIDMDENLAAPIVIVGSGISVRYKKFLLTYRIAYLRFSKIVENVNAEANFLSRNHLRHEFNLFLML